MTVLVGYAGARVDPRGGRTDRGPDPRTGPSGGLHAHDQVQDVDRYAGDVAEPRVTDG